MEQGHNFNDFNNYILGYPFMIYQNSCCEKVLFTVKMNIEVKEQ